MLDTDTKRRIDTARDILVGKVPDPKSQVEQITIALIYKFMDDMDAESEESGGKRKFFADGFSRYGWPKLMRSGLSGHETLNLYAEAITRMPENPGIPPLFRDIFKNAYLPYRDPETLRAFLKVIDEFTYDHSERLGDAFEYLLSVLGSQGDAGQFRTPRHIIDFIVEIVDPKKTDVVLDPACGTAGFLISSYKHILKANTDERENSTLTPDERGRLAQNFKGYDISPDMVRLSLVNMYLHGFVDPHIYEYDTLTSLDRWTEYADVILANPPFMSPKGGIRPHNRFSVQSKRSEVLFVDYIAEHLKPTGRAGIIVPEGVIFQGGTAYKQLRKMLVEDYLVAVISLPAGVFNPYSGVKTSILILDKSLAKKANTIAFFKVENDGYSLGAQRREIDKNDLPQATVEIANYLDRLRTAGQEEHFHASLGLFVAKKRIEANGDYSLSGERYRENGKSHTVHPLRSIQDIALEIKPGFASGQSNASIEGVPHIRPMNITETGQFTWHGVKRISESEFAGKREYLLQPNDVLFNNTNSRELVGKTCLIEEPILGGYSNHITRIRTNPEVCIPRFLAVVLHGAWRKGLFLERATRWVGQAGINTKSLSEFLIPLPPLEVQREIVAEIEGYQKVIDGARAVVEGYHPHIHIHPDWPMVRLGSVAEVQGGVQKSRDRRPRENHRPYLTVRNVQRGYLDLTHVDRFEVSAEELARLRLQLGDVLVVEGNGSREQIGRCALFELDGEEWVHQNHVIRARPDQSRALPRFLSFFLNSRQGREQMLIAAATTSGLYTLSVGKVESLRVPCPSVAEQESIVAEIEAEQALVNANRELIVRFERKIQATLARVWGEGEAT